MLPLGHSLVLIPSPTSNSVTSNSITKGCYPIPPERFGAKWVNIHDSLKAQDH